MQKKRGVRGGGARRIEVDVLSKHIIKSAEQIVVPQERNTQTVLN
jgi:hypothetical protein